MESEVVIIGAGASGLMCAITAAKRGRKTVIIDHNKSIGSKILVSGGGHCNFTNLNLGEEHYISSNPHFVKSAISRFGPQDIINFLNSHKIAHENKKNGQIFCKGTSKNIVEMLRKECIASGVEFFLNTKILSVVHTNCFVTKTDKMEIKSGSLVVATGGLSYPSLGASDLGFKIAREFKIKTTELKPALVPLVFGKHDRTKFSVLSGVSFKGRVSYKNTSFTDDILFTHSGLSGPAILQISGYWEPKNPVLIDFIPYTNIYHEITKKKKDSSKILFKNLLSHFIPKRLAEILCVENKITGSIGSYSEKYLKDVCKKIHNYEITPVDTEGYKKAEATLGGVDTSAVSSKTMESTKIKGLYFIGEVLDVVGHLGGYNMHWAFASGHAAGQFV